jgi:hypothetical protein
MTFQVPPTLNTAQFELIKENEEQLGDVNWHFYRFVNDQCPARPGLLATTNREKSRLVEIISDIAIMMYTQQGPQVSAHHVLQQYERLVSWRVKLPSMIGKLESNDSQALPHLLSLL